MAEPENATRAPESDAYDPGASAAGDAAPPPPPQPPTASAPVVGEHCVSDRPTPAGQASTGEIIKLAGVDVYISKPVDYPHTPSRLLLLLTGGTGIKSTNNQLQADKFASEGYLVLMPDLFDGQPAPGSAAIMDDSTSLLEQIKIKAVEVSKSFLIDMWLARVTPERVMPILHKVIDAAHQQYKDSITQGGGIYAVGYCVGARFVLHLSHKTELSEGSDAESGTVRNGPLIKAGALAHAASVAPDDFQNVNVPLSLVCVEDDPLFPEEVRRAGEDTMSNANLEHEVQVYPGVPHGFAVVGVYQDEAIKDAQATAYDQMLKWIQAH